jgi:YaiO family outer membrane protein
MPRSRFHHQRSAAPLPARPWSAGWVATVGAMLCLLLAAEAAPATLEEAQRLAREQKLNEAAKVMEQLRQQEPQNTLYLLRHGQYLSWAARLNSSAAAYQELLKRHPEDRDARTGLGLTHFWRGNWQTARECFEAVLAVEPEHEIARDAYLRLLVAQSRNSEAYQKARVREEKSGGKDAELGLILAGIHATAGDDVTADQLAQRPTPDEDLRRRQVRFRAQRKLALQQPDEALKLSGDCVAAHMEDYNSLVDDGDVQAATDHVELARERYQAAIKRVPERPEAPLGMARLASRRNRWPESEDWCRKVVTDNPEAIEGWLGLARAQQAQGKMEEAWASLDAALKVAPGSALVFEAQLKLARSTNDRQRFDEVLAAYRAAQPEDRRMRLWEQDEHRRRGEPVDTGVLRALLDPLAPETTVPALHLIGKQSREAKEAAWSEMPVVPDAALNSTAREELEEGLRQTDPAVFGMRVGYEYAWTRSRQAGGSLPDWQETYVALFWREPQVQSFWLNWHHYERFGTDAAQLLGGWERELGEKWRVRLSGGGDLYGNFLADWRAGAGVTYQCCPKFALHLDGQYLSFPDLEVWQLVPGFTWQIAPKWESTIRVYAGRSDLRLGPARDETTWRFSYAYGDEDSSNPVRNLVGEQNFQAAGVELQWQATERLLVIPSFRFERHRQFDLFAPGLALQWRF